MSNQEVIAFLGRQGSGKNYQSDRLIKTGYKKLSFADPLRKMACKVIGIDYEKAMRKYDELQSQLDKLKEQRNELREQVKNNQNVNKNKKKIQDIHIEMIQLQRQIDEEKKKHK